MIRVNKTEIVVVNLDQDPSPSIYWENSSASDVVEVHVLESVSPHNLQHIQEHLELRFHNLDSLNDLIYILIQARNGFKLDQAV